MEVVMKGALYEAEDGVRWHLKAGNGRIVAESGEAYNEERKAHAAFDKVFVGMYPLTLLDGEIVLESAPPELDASKVTTGTIERPHVPADDRLHPLYSPLTLDGNKK